MINKIDVDIKYSLLLPVPAIALGAFAAFQNNISPLAFLWNGVAVAIGIGLSLWLARRRDLFENFFLLYSLALILVVVLALSLFDTGMDGVKRYLSLGRLMVNPSAIFSPLLLFCTFLFLKKNEFWALFLTSFVTAIHFLQPDAGQATAFGGAAIVLFLFGPSKLPIRFIGCVIAVAGVIMTWQQPDPLPAVEHVEGILHLIARAGVGFIFLEVIIFLSLLLPMLQALRKASFSSVKCLMWSLIIYVILTFVVTEVGNFPVPLFGGGASPVLGYYLILGLIRLI
ncbi:MAG: hypothetical protein AB7O96_08720 [Pseudobdellovibrionaceae bacterium]